MNLEKIKSVIPLSVYVELLKVINDRKLNLYQVTHFISQCVHESGNFHTVFENLNYSEKGLLKTFSKYFNKDNVSQYAHQPVLIASRVYANRMGNGSEVTKDGWEYRGKGYIQLTGKDTQLKFLKTKGYDITTDIDTDVIANIYPLESAAWFFDEHEIWNICVDDKKETVKKVTKIINGGDNGLEERISLFCRYYDLLK